MMWKVTAALLVVLVLAVACTSVAPAVPTLDSNAPVVEDTATAASPVEKTKPASTATQPLPSATQIPTFTATATPLPTPTPMPAVYDQANYRQFAVARSSFPGYLDFTAERSTDELGHAFSLVGDRIAVSGCWGSLSSTGRCESPDSGFLVVLDANTGDLVTEIPLGESWPGGVAFTPDGKNLLYGTTERKIALWDLEANQPGITLLHQPSTGSVRYPVVAASPDGSSYAAVFDEMLYVWDPSGDLLFQTPATKSYYASGAIDYSDDGTRLAALSKGKVGAEVYDTSNGSLVGSFAQADIIDVALSPDGQKLAGAESTRDTVVVWDVETGNQLAELDPGHWARHISFNPAGDLLLVSGMGNLETRDSYSKIGSVYETQAWTRLEQLYSFTESGEVEFSRDGSRMAMLSDFTATIWELPDAQLTAGFEVVQAFQSALNKGDYAAAADLFSVQDWDRAYLQEIGIDPDDLPGSFERLCAEQTIFCYPVQELVMMGHDWDYLTYLVRLAGPDGNIFQTPMGAEIIYLYLAPGSEGKPRIMYPPME